MTLLTPSEQRGLDRLVADGVLSKLPRCRWCSTQCPPTHLETHENVFCTLRPAAEKEAKE